MTIAGLICDCGNYGDVIGVVGIVVMTGVLVALVVWTIRDRRHR